MQARHEAAHDREGDQEAGHDQTGDRRPERRGEEARASRAEPRQRLGQEGDHAGHPASFANEVCLCATGANFSDFDGFAREFSTLLCHYAWHGNLDAFNDILRGGFGTPEGGWVLR
ncbi:hypothetical protein L3i22_068550 [Actinoplanes sp. L3-i22]|nr:hypothetical protein L3i22_068550 [Actinoplanes sp. L3-i22]